MASIQTHRVYPMCSWLRSAARRLGLGHVKRAILGASEPKSVESQITLPPRPRSTQSRYLSIAAIFKNEAPYLAEWLEFHRMMGVEHVYLYDNGSTDDPDIVLAPFVRDGYVTVLPWQISAGPFTPQPLAYAHAIQSFGPAWRWMALIDIDEFLFPVAGNRLPDVLRRYEDLPALAVPWTMFGFSGHETRPAGVTIENYTMRAPFPPPPENKVLFKWKSILNPRAVRAVIGPHDFEFESGMLGGGLDENRAPLGNETRYAAPRTTNILRLNHYTTRSKAEFRTKLTSTSANESDNEARRRRQKFADMIESDTHYDDTILRFVPELKKRLSAAGAGSSRPDCPRDGDVLDARNAAC